MFVSFSSSPAAFADTVDDPGVDQGAYPGAGSNGSELAEGLLSLLDASRTQVEAILEQLALDGVVIPDAVYETISLAEEAAAEALLLMESGMYPEASEKATEALQLYGEALQMALDSNYGAQEIVTEDGSTDLPELWATFERCFAYLREVNVTFRKLEEAGVNMTCVDDFIGEAERGLAQAEEFLQQGDAEGAEEALDSAFKSLDGAMTFMQSLNEGLTAKKAAVFLAKSERRFERLEGDILNLVDPLSFEPEDFDAMLQTLEDANLKNRELKDILEGGDLSALKGELEGFQEYSDDVFGILDEGDKELAKDLRKAYKAEVKISKHEDKKASKNLEVTPSDPDPEVGPEPEDGDPKDEPDPNDITGDGETKPAEPIENEQKDGPSD